MSLLTWLFGPREIVRPDLCSETFAAHDDELIDKHLISSPYEQMTPATREEMTYFNDNHWVKKVVFTFKCKKCGRVAQKEHSNAEELQNT